MNMGMDSILKVQPEYGEVDASFVPQCLKNFRNAFQERPNLSNLLLDPGIAKIIGEREEDLRTTIQRSAGLGIATPGLMASYNYLKSYSRKRLPANLIQAQRDYFGAHRYQRVDADETFHTNWEDAKN